MIKFKNKLPQTNQRVALKTDSNVNAVIRNQTLWNLKTYQNRSREEVSARIKKLEFEWDTERVLETNAAAMVVFSTILGLVSKKCWFLVTGTVGFFLLQHALDGWCPPVPVIRKMGVRTAEEIHNEKIVLKLLRGDFQQNKTEIEEMLNMVEKR